MKSLNKMIILGTLLTLSATAYSLNAEEIYKKVNQSVYTIYTVNFYDKSPESLGSAIAVTDHILATNCHVALTGNYLGIVINNEFKLGTLFFRDVNRDICFVEVPGIKFNPVKIRESKDVKVGEAVYAVGNPEGLEKSISQGIISNKKKDRGGYVLQTDATVSFGSSGGGLFDQNGDLIGITNSVDRNSKNIAFAIPTEWINQILFPKTTATDKAPKQVADKEAPSDKTLKNLGTFGKANIVLYHYNQKCFVMLTAKNEFGEAAGSAIWYPEKPGIILIFPNSTNVDQNFKIMNKAFAEDQPDTPVYSKNYLIFGDKKFELVGIKDENGRFPILVTKLPANARDILLKLTGFDVKYGDGMTIQNYTKSTYTLDGLSAALSAYSKQCKGSQSETTDQDSKDANDTKATNDKDDVKS